MKLLKQIETLFRAGTSGGISDAQLLDRFVQGRDEAAESAFAALVDRHGAMVLRVCRQVLGDDHDAEDAAQATFLVLARRASAIGRRASVASWLHGVALRVAAKARVAAARRRKHEERGGVMRAARQVVEHDPESIDDPARWTKLHDELARLPAAFREPLVLCYFEGLTQEQAAATLRCPLGTVQSRLARGRARLKARLAGRDLELSATFPGTCLHAAQHPAAPPAWAEATVRLAMQFTNKSLPGTASAAAAALAEVVLRAMLLTKLKVASAAIVIAALVISGAATWARQQGQSTPSSVAVKQTVPKEQPQPEPVLSQSSQGPKVRRTIRGTVRDGQGQPMVKAWIGSGLGSMSDVWKPILARDRLRVAKQPFRDDKGNEVPAGPIGDYYEYRNDDGQWQQIDPADIRPYDPARGSPTYLSAEEGKARRQALSQVVAEIRLAKGRHKMRRLDENYGDPAPRTDAQGRFAVEVPFAPEGSAATVMYCASADFRLKASRVVRMNESDRPVEIILKPSRLVVANVVETPKDHPDTPLTWTVYPAD
jgi:RNA polymerase sigma factor (sigma-70 family)